LNSPAIHSAIERTGPSQSAAPTGVSANVLSEVSSNIADAGERTHQPIERIRIGACLARQIVGGARAFCSRSDNPSRAEMFTALATMWPAIN
jgi:uncharacterized linocin/CFP29 family protein